MYFLKYEQGFKTTKKLNTAGGYHFILFLGASKIIMTSLVVLVKN